MKKPREKIRQITMMGMMLAIIVVLSALEHALPPIPGLPPNMRLGLSNVVTMYTIFFIGYKQAVLLAVLKSLFVLAIRGGLAGLLSFSGGILAVFGIIAFAYIFGKNASYIALSITGAVLHNLGQIVVVALILDMSGMFILIYLPVLIVSGVIMGTVTGSLLSVAMPLFNKWDSWT